MTTSSWFDEEAPASASLRQAARLVVAGFKRPFVLLVVAAIAALALAAVVLFSKRSYAPEYLLRVVEPERDSRGMPRPRRQLAEYVRQAVFTSKPLLEIMSRYGLYPSLARKNPRAALESFKEDIQVEVYQNYFVEDRPIGSAPRSARLSVSYHNASPELAVQVTRELGALIVDHERAARRAQATRAAESAKHEVDAAREALIARRAQVASEREQLEKDPFDDPRRRVELVGLLGSLPRLEARQNETERREAELSLGAALERSGNGMSFQVVDNGALASGAGARNSQIGFTVATFLLALPLMAMGVGAFAKRNARL
jgi:hypothetical protein